MSCITNRPSGVERHLPGYHAAAGPRYRAAWNADAVSYDENSVRPSVCLSVRPSVRQTREL